MLLSLTRLPFRRRQLLGWGLLTAAALLGGAWLLQLDFKRKFTTDVLDLIPTDAQTPELALVRSLASQAEARTMLFVLTRADGAPAPLEAAQRFAAALVDEPAFDQAVAMGNTVARDALGHELFEQRFTLLFPLWLRTRVAAYAATGEPSAGFSTWLARDTATALNRFLTTPEALAFEELVPTDPLLLMAEAVERLQSSVVQVQPDAASPGTPVLVWARLSASPFSEAGQAPAFAAIGRAIAKVQTEHPGLQVADTGVNRFAAASRARIEREVKWLNAVSLAAVLLVVFVFIRQVRRGLHLLPIMLLSVLGAWVAATLAFDRLHVLVLVVGSLLTGVAIDYGFYLFMQPPLQPGEDYWEKVRRLAKPLLASCLTTVAGFAMLLFSELPFIRQLGVFVGAGLVCALVTAVVYFSTVRNPFLESRPFRGGQALPAGVRRSTRWLLLLLWLAALPGLTRLQWRDDIRELEIPSPALKQESARINALFGADEDRTVYLTYADSALAARDRLEKLEAWLATAGGGRTQTIGLGAVIPTAATHARAVRFGREHPDFPAQLRAALETAGFAGDAFEPFFTAYARHVATATEGDLHAALAALAAKLTGPDGLLLHTTPPLCWFVTLASHAPTATPPAETQTISASQLQSLNGVFSHYRQSALRLSLIGLAIIGAGVFLTYGWRDGMRIFAIPCGACLGLFGLLGWLGQPLNLFHLLGAFLGVCLTHNYSIFTATSAYRHEPLPVSVRLSGLTTAAAFGVLALSGIPVVRALGSTVALMVVAALVVIEFEYLGALGDRHEPHR